MRCLRNGLEYAEKEGEQGRETHKKESVGQERICENSPPYPSSRSLPAVQYLSYDQRDNNANKFVSRICDEVE